MRLAVAFCAVLACAHGALVLDQNAAALATLPVTIANANVPSVDSATGFTLVANFQQTSPNVGYLFANGHADSDQRCFSVLLAGGTTVGVFYGEKDSGTRQEEYLPALPSFYGSTVTLALTVGNGVITQFLDGVQYGNARALVGTAATCSNNAESAFVGVRPPRAQDHFPFDGQVNWLQVYDSVLSPSEIVSLSVAGGVAPDPSNVIELPSASFPSTVTTVPVVTASDDFTLLAQDVTLNSATSGYLFANSVGDNDGRCMHFFYAASSNKLGFFYGEHDGARVELYSDVLAVDPTSGTHDLAVSVASGVLSFYANGVLSGTRTLSRGVVSCPTGTVLTGARPPTSLNPFTLDGSVGNLLFTLYEIPASAMTATSSAFFTDAAITSNGADPLQATSGDTLSLPGISSVIRIASVAFSCNLITTPTLTIADGGFTVQGFDYAVSASDSAGTLACTLTLTDDDGTTYARDVLPSAVTLYESLSIQPTFIGNAVAFTRSSASMTTVSYFAYFELLDGTGDAVVGATDSADEDLLNFTPATDFAVLFERDVNCGQSSGEAKCSCKYNCGEAGQDPCCNNFHRPTVAGFFAGTLLSHESYIVQVTCNSAWIPRLYVGVLAETGAYYVDPDTGGNVMVKSDVQFSTLGDGREFIPDNAAISEYNYCYPGAASVVADRDIDRSTTCTGFCDNQSYGGCFCDNQCGTTADGNWDCCDAVFEGVCSNTYDTPLCPSLGVLDCNGACVDAATAASMIGDGNCDSRFDCSSIHHTNFDAGDCFAK